jgi:uncharacterized membrane protein YgcG
MKHFYRFLAIFIIFSGIVSCDDDDCPTPVPVPAADRTIFVATLHGENEVPPNESNAEGIAVLTFNNTTKQFTLVGAYNGMTATVAHIHGPASTTENAAIIFTLTVTANSPATSGKISYATSSAITPAQEADLLAGKYYVNIHSTTYALPTGEIRGQLEKIGVSSSGSGGSGGGGGGGGY